MGRFTDAKRFLAIILAAAAFMGISTVASHSFERNVSSEEMYQRVGLRSYNDLKIGETTGVYSSNLCWENNEIFLISSSPIDEFATRISVTKLDENTVGIKVNELPSQDQDDSLKRHFVSIFSGFSCEGVRLVFSPSPTFLMIGNINGFDNLEDLLESLK